MKAAERECPICVGAGTMTSCPTCGYAFAPSDANPLSGGEYACPLPTCDDAATINLIICGVCKGTGKITGKLGGKT